MWRGLVHVAQTGSGEHREETGMTVAFKGPSLVTYFHKLGATSQMPHSLHNSATN